MRRALRLLIWLAVLAACAGVGAFIASRTDPFPPGVDDPGALAPAPSVAPTVAWAGGGVLRSTHELFVGGSCRSSWRVRLTFDVRRGIASGSGAARLVGDATCDFPTAQLQARRVRFPVSGEERGPRLALRFGEAVLRPIGSIDLGGFVALLERTRPQLAVSGDLATGMVAARSSDGERGGLEVRGRIRVRATGRS